MKTDPLILPPDPIQPPPIQPPTATPIIESRTVWANVIVMAAIVIAKRYGFELSVDEQAVIVAGLNIALRFVTKGPLTLMR